MRGDITGGKDIFVGATATICDEREESEGPLQCWEQPL